MTAGTPAFYPHRSEGSGKIMNIHFCATCSTKIYLSFERFADVVGVFGSTFDDPDWFERTPENTKYIFLLSNGHSFEPHSSDYTCVFEMPQMRSI